MDERFIDDYLQLLKKENNPLKKALILTAIITEMLRKKKVMPILVGGRALEFYTLGGYATKDIDLVINDRESAKEVLAKLGFTKRPGERHWYNEEIDLAIEIPDEELAGSLEKIIKVEIDDLEVNVIGIEDLIIDRLLAAKFWQSVDDEEWATKILAIHYQRIDFNYLKETAIKNQVNDYLDKIINESRKILDKLT
ncbi:DUF6036 family nucleotidyltransferase [Thermovenabulum sp.]|uniref:DUF6036 family nucleotidyltransferase n=1 Tax=Thermovenabulum sp. TaxID=3100335 RepID=UPI003C7A28C5